MSRSKKDYRIILANDIRLEVVSRSIGANAKYSKNQRAVERIWQNALISSPGLINGTMVNLVRMDRRSNHLRIQGHLVEYKYFLAHLRRPSLKLAIHPVGVSGLVVLREGRKRFLVLARRSDTVTLFPGFLELVPSGNIDDTYVDRLGRVDYLSQLLAELREETGLSKRSAKKVVGFAVVLDTRRNVCDICCKVVIDAQRRSIAKGFDCSKEYHDVVFVAESTIGRFLAQNAQITVPTSVALLRAYETR